MNKKDIKETREFWNNVAGDWNIQVGDEGDKNRMLNSDPVLWKFAGNITGLKILDAGCGTGYLTRKLRDSGADVIGIDFSENMIDIARAKNPGISFYVDSCSELRSVDDDSQDMIIANYVLMDTPDLNGTMQAFNRVLKVNGVAIVIFSHPCFPQGSATVFKDEDGIQYSWTYSYFDQWKFIDPPWGHFTSEFIWFHRPLSDYWKAFKTAGFDVEDFEEPRIAEEKHHLAENQRILYNSKNRPYSVAFKLRRRGSV